jgi:hypothetical protein
MQTSKPTLPQLEVRYDDDPRVVREAATEDYALHVVPKTARVGRWSLAMAWYAVFSAMFFLISGALAALAVGTVNALVGMGLAVVAHSAVNYVLVPYAIRTGTTVNLFSRVLFGYLGSALAVILLGATALFYATFEASVIAVAFSEYFGGLPLELWYLVVVLYSVPLVFGGIRLWLDKLNGFLLPFYVVGLAVAVAWTVAEFGYSNEWLTFRPEAPAEVAGPGWLFAFTIYMANTVLAMYMWDFARYGREEDIGFHRLVTFGPLFYSLTYLLNGAIGIFLASNIPTDGPLTELSGVLGMVALMGLFAVAFVWVSQTRINTANLYVASLNFQNFFARVFKLRLSRMVWAVFVGALAYLFMLVNVFSVLVVALQYLGMLVLAWVGIAITHVAWARLSGSDPDLWEWRPGRVPLANWGGLGSWTGATALGVALLELAGPAYASWAAPATFLAAVALYAGALAVRRRGWYVLERPHDPRAEVADPWEARVRCAECDRSFVAIEMDRNPGSGHGPICASCAQGSPTFYRDAKAEARNPRAAEVPNEPRSVKL